MGKVLSERRCENTVIHCGSGQHLPPATLCVIASPLGLRRALKPRWMSLVKTGVCPSLEPDLDKVHEWKEAAAIPSQHAVELGWLSGGQEVPGWWWHRSAPQRLRW